MVLTKAWELYKENWRLILGIIFLGGVLLGIVNAAIFYLSFSFAAMDGNKDTAKIILIILNLILWIGYLLWITPLIYAVNELQAGIKITIKEAFKKAFENFNKIAVFAAIVTLVFLLYVIPTYINIEFYVVIILLSVTLILAVWHALFIPIWFLQDISIGKALANSRKMLEGKRLAFIFELIGIYILFYVLMQLFILLLGWPINKLFNISEFIIYPYIILNTIIYVILASLVVVWLYCYYINLKESEL